MNTKDIEEFAVTEVKKAILKSGYLEQYISENDKGPSYDGQIYIYNNKEKKKKDFVGSVSVQVKGTLVESLPQENIKFDVSVVDAKNYLATGGVIYFVVCLTTDFQHKIYYHALTPIKLYGFLEEAKEQQTKRIQFIPFPENGERQAEIFSNFYQDSRKQHSFSEENMISADELKKAKDIVSISTSITRYGNRTNERSLLENEVYLYATKKGVDVKIPIKIIPQEMFIEENPTIVVSSNGKVFYTSVRRIKTKIGTRIIIGKSVSFFLNNENDNTPIKINYQLCDNLKDQVVDLDFFLNMITSGEFSLNDKKIKLNVEEFKGTLDFALLQKQLECIKKIKAVFDILHIEKDLKTSTLDVSDKTRLSELVTAFYDKQIVRNWREDLPDIIRIKVQNIHILLIAKRVEGEAGAYRVSDFFAGELVSAYNLPENGEEHVAPIYAILKADDYCQIDNIYYEGVVSAYQSIYEKDPLVLERATVDMLNIIKAFDKTGNKKQWEIAVNLCDWIAEKEGDNVKLVTILNKLQLIRRRRQLSEKEKDTLYCIIEDGNSTIEEKIGAYILLGNRRMARLHLQKLEIEQQKHFKEYPIYKRFYSK